MSEDEVRRLIHSHIDWLRDSTLVQDVGDGWTEITTPYIDRHNDMLQLYVSSMNDRYVLSDGGYILDDLMQSGCNIDTPRRREILAMTLNGFGVSEVEGELRTFARKSDFALRQHSLIQAMLAVNDMFFLSQPTVESLFVEDVERWLTEANVRFVPNAMFSGKSGLSHRFGFTIPRSRVAPERIVDPMNHPSVQAAETFTFKWLDTRDTRDSTSVAYVIINDQDSKVSDSVIETFAAYQIKSVFWSQRADFAEQLAV